MKHIKLYEEYTSKPDHPGFFKTYEETRNWLDQMEIENYTIKDDLSVDVKGSVFLDYKSLKYIPVQFGEVTGVFDCSHNQLTNLKGCPSYVDSDFRCYNNQLTSLKGCPSFVGMSFSCQNNQLTSLKGCPSFVGMAFDCSNNQLTSLTGCPRKVGGNFYCSDNQLTSLTGGPSYVSGNFYCYDNQLTSLTGCPSEVGGYFFSNKNYLTIDEPYNIRKDNPGSGYKDTSLTKITQNFLDKLETSGLDTTSQLRILRSLETSKPQVYTELGKLVDLDDWLSRLTNSKTHIDIMNL